MFSSTLRISRFTKVASFVGAAALAASVVPESKSECAKCYPRTNLKGKVVLVTGATSGIGKAVAWRFAEEGVRLVLIGRRGHLLDALKKDLQESYPSMKVHTEVLDVTDFDAVQALPDKLPCCFKDVLILVNNAGLALGVDSVDQNKISDAKTVMTTNVLGVTAFCSSFIPGMLERQAGHLVNVGSVAGHHAYKNGTVYNASKFAVRGFTEAAMIDLVGTPLRVTHVSPGMVQTAFSNVRLGNDKKADAVYENIVPLTPEDIADNIVYACTRPAHVQIADIKVYATNQARPDVSVKAGPKLGAK